LILLVEGESLGFARRHPAEEIGGLSDPADVGHKRDPFPVTEVFDPRFQVLPERSSGHAVEVAHNDQEADAASLRCPLDGGEDDVAVVLGGELPARFESDYACR
jgi:hypothetical protein